MPIKGLLNQYAVTKDWFRKSVSSGQLGDPILDNQVRIDNCCELLILRESSIGENLRDLHYSGMRSKQAKTARLSGQELELMFMSCGVCRAFTADGVGLPGARRNAL